MVHVCEQLEQDRYMKYVEWTRFETATSSSQV